MLQAIGCLPDGKVIFGNRRARCAPLAGLKTVPVVIKIIWNMKAWVSCGTQKITDNHRGDANVVAEPKPAAWALHCPQDAAARQPVLSGPGDQSISAVVRESTL